MVIIIIFSKKGIDIQANTTSDSVHVYIIEIHPLKMWTKV